MNSTNLSSDTMIKVDGAHYDPYYILQVTEDDSDEHIAKAYRRKAKRYHPDKAPSEKTSDYTLKFKIVTEAYNYIRNKRLNANVKSSNKDMPVFENVRFNEEFTRRADLCDPNKYGYGEQKRIEKVEEYDEFSVDIVDQFAGKTFNHEEFNKLFEYNMTLQEKNNDDIKTIVHKTTDGFYGYNTADIGSSAMIHSYNGLMVTGDDFGESGIGYWGGGYSDYKKAFTSVRNPEKVVQVPNDYKTTEPVGVPQTYEDYKNSYYKDSNVAGKPSTFRQEQEVLCNRMISELVEGEKKDEAFVLKYAKQYEPKVVRAALNGDLERSASLLDNLHYRFKSIRGDSS